MKFVLLSISLSLFFLIFFSSGCIEETPVAELDMTYVDGEGKADYASIQDAVDNASDGDTIFVYAGVYRENVVVNKSINITGEDRDKTVIDGGSYGDVLHISADWVNISGFKIQNGGDRTSYKGQGQDADAGIDIRSNNTTISNNEIVSNDGCGVYVCESEGNKIMNNNFSNNKYGIYTYKGDRNNISGNNVSFSSMYGIYLYTGSDENVIYSNTIYDNEYGIRVKGSKYNEICCNDIIYNRRGLYFCCGSVNNVIFYNLFTNNSIWNADDSYNNQWDNSSIGNFWDDYTGVDADNDGIGDTPYNISNGDSQDNYPLILTTEVFPDFDSKSPIASFGYSPSIPSEYPDTVQFTDLSNDRDGNIISWFWDFGDGDTSNEQNSMHSYNNEGTYYVTLTVTDDDGFTDTETKTIIVKNKEENIPVNFKINSPYDGDIVKETILITGIIGEGEPIKIVEIRIDKGEWIQADGLDPWRYEWDTTEVDDGVHIIYARSYDGYHYSATAAIKVSVDNADD
jgi:parallel beta-helix repeat protein